MLNTKIRPNWDGGLRPYAPEITTDLSGVSGRYCARLRDYWLENLDDDGVGHWSKFKLVDLYDIAPSLIVFDVLSKSREQILRYRFVGTQIVAFRRHRNLADPTGKTFHDADRAYDPGPMLEAYMRAVKDRRPVLMKGRYETEVAVGTHERLVVPWRQAGPHVTRLAVALDRMSS